ncbi:chemotaxis protein CheA [Aminiphilus sp.]|uniref:chemotaxis protein CheA n=1 Tax=Aminiphilus sp. TaxID=1872488 RepID=UPI00262EACEB|nr:chemotaxis protein CheA [Aminiphilus sp.]
MTNMDMSQYLGAFLDESTENLQNLNDLLLSLEKSRSDDGCVNEIFRIAHTLKGMSSTMGFEVMAHLTHAMEDMLDLVRKGQFALHDEDISILFKCLDALTAMVEAVRGGGDDHTPEGESLPKALHARISAVGESGKTAPGKEEAEKRAVMSDQEREWVLEAKEQGMDVFEIRVVLDAGCMLKAARAYMVVSRAGELGEIIRTVPPVEELEKEAFDEAFILCMATHELPDKVQQALSNISEVRTVEMTRLEGHQALEAASDSQNLLELVRSEEAEGGSEERDSGAETARAQATEAVKRTGRTVRVDIGRLDKLMNLVGELVIGRARIERLAMEAKLKAFEEPLSQLGRISGEIQELVTKLRMVPVSFVFDRFPRLVRDLSKNMGKEVRLTIEGKETELDRTVIDEIGDPMVHLIRNCLDHGIERPEDRKRMGKSREGEVYIAAYQEGNGVIIEVRDDGKGIDPAKIRAKALEKGIISRDEAQSMTDEELIRLVLLPGFSTAEEVTDLSGRGVGMDAVKSKVESLGGQFQIESKVGEGTRVLIRLPLTLAIVLALLIRVGDETYAISLENVEETLLVNKDDIKYVHGTPVTNVRGEILSLKDLAGILGTEVNREAIEEHPVVVVRSGRTRIGFIVDELVGQQEIVIKPLGKLLAKVRGMAGATILGDGNVALILDVASLHGR